MSSVQGSNVVDLEVVSSKCRSGAVKKSYWDCRLVENGKENLEPRTVEDRLGRSDVSQNLVKNKWLFLEGN